MELLDDPMVMREIIMDHYQNPHTKEFVDDESYVKLRKDSPTCIDDITVQMKIDGGQIKDVRFDGIACTIATASTDIAAKLLKGKSVEEGLNIISHYKDMIDEKDFDAKLLEELVVFKNVSKQANRIKCATIGIEAMEELLK